MQLGCRIALDVNEKQLTYLKQAAGVNRFAWNWALHEWQEMSQAWHKDKSLPYPSGAILKAKWNALRKEKFPWSYEVTKCAGQQAILDLSSAFHRAFKERREAKANGRKPRKMFGFPKFKSKSRTTPGFALWNDCFSISDHFYGGKHFSSVRVPHLGEVRLRELIPHKGKILGARISCRRNRWFISITFDTHLLDGDLSQKGQRVAAAKAKKLGLPYESEKRELIEPIHPHVDTIGGFDMGLKDAIIGTIIGGDPICVPNPRRLKKSLHEERIIRRRKRRLSRSIHRARVKKSIATCIELSKTKHHLSNRQKRLSLLISKRDHKNADQRGDFLHKLSHLVASSSELIVLEDLYVAGMVKNHCLAKSVSDSALGELRRQIEYKSELLGGLCLIAPRWFASSKRCFECGELYKGLVLGEDFWVCETCGSYHDRDENASKNLALLGELAANDNEIPEDLAKWTNWIHDARIQVEEWRTRKSVSQTAKAVQVETSFDVQVGAACSEFTRREITERGTDSFSASGVVDELRTKKNLLARVGCG